MSIATNEPSAIDYLATIPQPIDFSDEELLVLDPQQLTELEKALLPENREERRKAPKTLKRLKTGDPNRRRRMMTAIVRSGMKKASQLWWTRMMLERSDDSAKNFFGY